MHKQVKFLLLLFAICMSFLSSCKLSVMSQAVVPIQITVEGRLILTEIGDENNSGEETERSAVDVVLRVNPDTGKLTGASSVRIRSNLSGWKLQAQRESSKNKYAEINPDNMYIKFETKAGPKANPDAGKLTKQFANETTLTRISVKEPTTILKGVGKTSVEKDPGNYNNWLEFISKYSYFPESEEFDTGEKVAVVTYSLVSL